MLHVNKQAIVYVDGFALYKGLLQRNHPQYKWLDPVALADRLLRGFAVRQVRYFTAKLLPTTNDPQIVLRQQVYLRALSTLDRLNIHYGRYVRNKVSLPLHPEQLDDSGRVITVKVKRPEEKGTDVSMAAHMLLDAFRDEADYYIILTNDSDLAEPIRILRQEMRRKVGLISVAGPNYNAELRKHGLDLVRQIRRGTLQASQLPEVIADQYGKIHKPQAWP